MKSSSLSVGLFGYGSFGKLLATYLGKHFPVVVYHPSARKSEKLPRNCQAGTIKQTAGCDVVILSVNLPRLEGLLQQIRSYLKPNALVVDVMSVKVKPVQLMRRLLPNTVQILATHPLFGPQSIKTNSLAGHKIIIHPVRIHNLATIKKFLSQTLGLKVIEMEPAEHDKKMALIHGLTFFLARGLMKMDLPDDGLSAPSYQKLLSLAELESHHSPELFKTIEAGNPYAAAVRQRFMRHLSRLHRQTIKDK